MALSASVSMMAAARPCKTVRRTQLRSSHRAALVAKTIVPVQRRSVTLRAMSGHDEEIAQLEEALAAARDRKEKGLPSTKKAASNGTAGDYTGASFNIQTFNAISPVGLEKFPTGKYLVDPSVEVLGNNPMAIMLRSHKLQVAEVEPTVRCIARCGAGTNNIPVDKMTELGIPVFNTPGANANAVKELVICSLLLASRGILEGNNHVNNVITPEEGNDYTKISKRIEADKSKFGVQEVLGKTLAVVGLGQIGARVVDAALALGMKVVGYDPALSLEAALMLSPDLKRVDSLSEAFEVADYLTLHVPYIPGVTHHLINEEALKKMKPNVHLMNFARGEIVDGKALMAAFKDGSKTGKYMSDFSCPDLMGHPRHVVLPHLGASTEEAEENSAAMAAETVKSFLETGSIRHSVNFPNVNLPYTKNLGVAARLCIVNKNTPGVLGSIASFLGNRNINILQQLNSSRGDVAYTVVDMQTVPEDPGKLQTDLASIDGIISSRFVSDPFMNDLGKPGTYFQVSWDEALQN